MQAPELAVEEMKRAAVDLKMPGFQIGSHVGDWNLDAKELYPIYKTAEELGTALFVHPWGMYIFFLFFALDQWSVTYKVFRNGHGRSPI